MSVNTFDGGTWTYDGIKLNSWRRDPADPRDMTFSQWSGAPSAVALFNVDLRQWCSPVEDQRQTNSCVGNSVVGALEIIENVQDSSQFVDLSRLFVYYNARAAIGEQGVDKGSHIRTAMSSLSSLGTCRESVWPFDVSKVTTRPSWSAYREGFTHRIGGYYRISNCDTSTIEKSLSSRCPVVFGCEVSENFMHVGRDGIVPMPSGRVIGAHAMLIVGFDHPSSTFIIRNSWGKTTWGDEGYGYVPYSFLSAANAEDIWSAMRYA